MQSSTHSNAYDESHRFQSFRVDSLGYRVEIATHATLDEAYSRVREMFGNFNFVSYAIPAGEVVVSASGRVVSQPR